MISSTLNTAPLEFWRQKKYTDQDILDLGASIDKTSMGCVIIFNCGETICRVSTKTWERQQGHYPTIASFFHQVANDPAMIDKKGSIFVWLEDGMWDTSQHLGFKAPILSFAKISTDHCSFLIPDPAFLGTKGYQEEIEEIVNQKDEVTWANKKPTIFWRGAASGDALGANIWRSNPRVRLCLKANEINDASILDAKITKTSHLGDEMEQIIIDAGVTGEPCKFTEFLKYKYILDVDGYSCAWQSLFLKLLSGSITLKIESKNKQWYYDKLEPWKHYIPVSELLRDINDVYDWLKANDDLAQSIAQNAKEFMKTISYESCVSDTAKLCAEILKCNKQ